MTEHIRQGNSDTCLLAVCFMAAGRSQKEFDLYRLLGGPYSLGGWSLSDAVPVMPLFGIAAGPIPSFSFDPVEQADSQPKRNVGLDSHLLANAELMSGKLGISVDRYLEDLVEADLRQRGIDLSIFDYAPENGITGFEATNKAGFQVFLPINKPAIVAVQTDKNLHAGHAIFWDGSTVFDPAKDEPGGSLDDYSISMWIPFTKTKPPAKAMLELLARIETAKQTRIEWAEFAST